jgi:hypothetical protein
VTPKLGTGVYRGRWGIRGKGEREDEEAEDLNLTHRCFHTAPN